MKKRISVISVTVIIFAFLVEFFVIGEPIDGNQLDYTITENQNTIVLRISAIEPAVALRGWIEEQDGANLLISANKVPVSFLFSSSDYQSVIYLDGIESIYLGGQMIWHRGAS